MNSAEAYGNRVRTESQCAESLARLPAVKSKFLTKKSAVALTSLVTENYPDGPDAVLGKPWRFPNRAS